MKIGSFTIFEKTKAKTEEEYRGNIAVAGTGKPKRKTFNMGEHTWLSRCTHFNQLAQDYPLFNQACLTLAGMVISQGTYLRPAVNKQDETYALAEEALWRCQKLNRQLRINSIFYQTAVYTAKYGACFWEITHTPSPSFRIPPAQEYIEPHETDNLGNVTRWRQIIHGRTTAEWATNPEDDAYLTIIPWNQTTKTWPYGTSLGTGLETELESLLDMETNAKDYMDKQAWPYEVLALGNENSRVLDSDYESARSQWRNRKPGEGLTTRNMPVNIIPGGTGSTPIRELAALCDIMRNSAHDGLMVAPISKLYNSTEASAKVLTQHIMTTLGQPIQWLLSEAYEEQILKPYLERQSFSRKSCPELTFESPDVHKKEEGEFWKGMVDAKIQTPQQAAEHLGLEYDEAFWEAEKKWAEKQMQRGEEDKEESKSEEEDGELNKLKEMLKRIGTKKP